MSLILSTAAMLSLLQGQTSEPRLMRTPAIYGETIVFSYAGDLWVAKAGGGVARHLTNSPGIEIGPKISADGKTVAFTGTYDGPPNVYTIPIEGGEPKRLTYDVEGDRVLGWMPDGKIAYGSTAGNFVNRQLALYTVSPSGGLPTHTVIDEVSEASFFPDGHTMAYNRQPSAGFNWRHYRGGNQGRISIYDFQTNKYSELPSGREQSYYPMVVGRSIYYTSSRTGGVYNLFRYDLDSKKDTQITKFTDADVRTPSTDGKTIAFERDGLLYLYDIATGAIRQPEIKILSENLNARPYLRSLGGAIQSVSLSPSGVRLAVEARGEIFSVPAKQGDTRNMTNSPASRERAPQWSPDGKTIAYLSDATGNYEIYTQPQLGGTPTRLTTSTQGTIEGITWSPDGKMLQYMTSDRSLWILEVATKKITKVTDAPYGLAGTDWSPDSRWLAFCRGGKNDFQGLYLYEVGTGKTTVIDAGEYSDDDVAFDLNGKYLYFVSRREFSIIPTVAVQTPSAVAVPRLYVIPLAASTPNPFTVASEEEPEPPADAAGLKPAKPSTPGGPQTAAPAAPAAPPAAAAPAGPPPIKIDTEGMSSRILPLPLPPGGYGNLNGSNNGLMYLNGGTLFRFDMTSREPAPILPGVQYYTLNASHTKLAYAGPGFLGVVNAMPGNPPGAGRVDVGNVEAVISPRDEWRQIFWEAWRYERDHYYDPSFRGLNWAAVGKQYEKYLDFVESRSDLNYVLGLMIGELGTSHSYVMGGDLGITSRPIPVGFLGVDYESAGGKIRFKKIYRGHSYEEADRAPLAEPGVDVKQGDYLLAIDGVPLDGNTNPSTLLLGKVARYVTLTINSSPSDVGSRKVRVKTIPSEGEIRYWDFVDSNRALVDKLSNGRIGYVHVRDTGSTGTVDLARGFFPQTDKDALIVDERWNGGGNLPNGFVELLARRARTALQVRNGADQPDSSSIDGPKAMLINGYAGSGGDMFPWLFQATKVGPLIGKRTWGGLVGISGGANLIDGGGVTAPEFSIYDRETGEIIAENHGVDPDVDVDRRPDEVANGKDAQLQAAIDYLLEELKKHPLPPPHKGVPRVGKQGLTP